MEKNRLKLFEKEHHSSVIDNEYLIGLITLYIM